MNLTVQTLGLYQREVARYMRVPLQTLGAPIVSTILYLMIFGLSLGNSISASSEDSYLAFLIPGLIAMSIIKNAFDNSTSAIMGSKYVNELQDLRIIPMSSRQISWAKSFASLSRGLVVGLITYIVGQLFYGAWQGALLPISHPFVLAYFVCIGGLSFSFLGIAIGMYARSFEHVGAVSALVLLPLIYLGGVFFSFENLHVIWQRISLFNPLFYIINGIRLGILGHSDVSLSLSIFITFFFTVTCYVLASRSLKIGNNYLR